MVNNRKIVYSLFRVVNYDILPNKREGTDCKKQVNINVTVVQFVCSQWVPDVCCCSNCGPRGTVNSEPRVLPFSHGPVQQFHLHFKHVSRTKEAQTFYLVAWFSHLIIKLSPNKIQL